MLTNNHLKFWEQACDSLGLREGFADKVAGLDHFLDEIEIMFEEIATANGLDAEPSTGL